MAGASFRKGKVLRNGALRAVKADVAVRCAENNEKSDRSQYAAALSG